MKFCECGGKTSVIESRLRKSGIYCRRRECTKCGERFTTYETRTQPTEIVMSHQVSRTASELDRLVEMLGQATKTTDRIIISMHCSQLADRLRALDKPADILISSS